MKNLTIFLTLLLCACTSVPINDVSTRMSFDIPAVNETAIARIGDYLLDKGTRWEISAIEVQNTFREDFYTVPAGIYRQIGEDAEKISYEATGITVGLLAEPSSALLIFKENPNELCIASTSNIYGCFDSPEANFIESTVVDVRRNSFQRTLIYNGKIGDVLRISYREFSDGIARPAFTNDVEYDLSQSNIIGYQGAELEVLDADNTSITYRVLSTFR